MTTATVLRNIKDKDFFNDNTYKKIYFGGS